MSAEAKKEIVLPPGPSENFGADLFTKHNPLELFPRLVREHGNVVTLKLGAATMVLLNEPELIERVVRKDHSKFVKGSLWWIKAVMGQGVGVAEGQEHRRQRKMMASSFTPKAVKCFAQTTVDVCARHAQQWGQGERKILPLVGEMALDIVCSTLFGCSTETEEIVNMRRALSVMKKSAGLGARQEEDVPQAMLEEFQEALEELDSSVLALVARSRENPGEDIISRLLTLKDDENKSFRDSELRDHAMAMMLAGHDSTADALAFSLYLLAKHPDVQERAFQEALACSEKCPESQVEELSYCRQIFAESMRLYPPSWIITRQNVESYELGPYRLPAGTYVRMCQWVTQRDSRFFPEPESFRPERWSPDGKDERPRFSYFPFGGGDRICLGQAKAWMEGPLMLAHILKIWRLEFVEEPTLIPAVVLSAPELRLGLQRR